MTVTKQQNLVIHAGNGVTNQFPYSFRIPFMETVVVSIQDKETGVIEKILDPSEYSITGVSPENYDGGEVFYMDNGVPLASDKNIIIARMMPYTQDLDLQNQGGFYPQSVEDQLDWLEMQIQQVAEKAGRAVLVPEGFDPPSVGDLNSLVTRAENAAEQAEDYLNEIIQVIGTMPRVDIKAFGAKGDAQRYGANGNITAGTNLFSSVGATFTNADVGKLIRIDGAGDAADILVAYIEDVVSSTQCRLSTIAQTTAVNKMWTYGTDDTKAFDAAFAAIEQAGKRGTGYLTEWQRSIIGPINAFALELTGGHYLYNGNGYRPNSEQGRCIIIYGTASNNALVEILSDVYLVDHPADGALAVNSVFMTGFMVGGGKGLYIDRKDVGVPQNFQIFHEMQILNFSECAIAHYASGYPRWAITRCTIETRRPNTKGIFFNPEFANPDLTGTTIVGCTYKIVCPPVGTGAGWISGATMFNASDGDHEADIWFMPGSSAGQGRGMWITRNRFSNENRHGHPWVLVAAPDPTTGTDLHQQRHSTQEPPIGERYFRDLNIVGNYLSGSGTSDDGGAIAGNLMETYTGELGVLRIEDNDITPAFTHILYFHFPPREGYASDLKIGPNKITGKGEAPRFCNLDIGRWYHFDGTETPSSGTNLQSQGGWDHTYFVLSRDGSGNRCDMSDLILNGGAIGAPTPGPFGQGTARQITFTTGDGSEFGALPVTGIAQIVPGKNIFVEWDVKKPAARGMNEVDFAIILNWDSGSETTRVHAILTDEWQTIRIPVNANASLTGMAVRIMPSPDDFVAGVRDRVLVDNPVAYAANRPVNQGHLFAGNASWSYDRLIMERAGGQTSFQMWPSWPEGDLLAGFFATGNGPASERQGSLIPLMANAGGGVAFIPEIEGTATPGTANYTAQLGRYFRLGKLVLGIGRVIWDSADGTGTLKVVLGNAPLCRNSAESRGLFIPIWTEGITLAAGKVLSGYINHGTRDAIITNRDNTGDGLQAVDASGTLYFAFMYEAE